MSEQAFQSASLAIDAGPSPRFAILTYCLMSIPLVFVGLGSYSIVNGDEAIYQEIAEEMLRSGNWFKLMSSGEHRIYDTFMNAPIQYWVRGVMLSWFGPGLLAMRLHSAVFGLATVLALYHLVLHIAGRRAAFFSGLIQLTTYQFIFLHGARTGELDTALCLLFVLAAHLFIRGMEDSRRGMILHHICFLLILNLKIPVVLVPTLAELLCFAMLPGARPLFRRWVATGLAILPLGLIWHIYQAIHLGDAIFKVLAEMQSQAAPTLRLGLERSGWSRVARYLPVLLHGPFPYSLFYPIAVFDVLRRSLRSGTSRERDGLWVLALYALSVFVFFALISKRGAWYLMPAYPFLAAFLGIWLARWSQVQWGKLTLLAVSVATSLWFWLVPRAVNPFAHTAHKVVMRTDWLALPGIDPSVGVPLLAGLLWAGGFLMHRLVGDRFQRLMAGGLALLLIGSASFRSASSLQFLGFQSGLGQLRKQIDRSLEAGKTLDFPVDAPPGHAWIVRYYFGRDFGLRRGQIDLDSGKLLNHQLAYRLYEKRQMEDAGKVMPAPELLNRFRSKRNPE